MSVGSVADDFIDAGVAAMIVAVSIAFAVSPVVVAGVVVTTVASIASVTVSSEISVAKTSETTIDGGMIGCSFQISGCLFWLRVSYGAIGRCGVHLDADDGNDEKNLYQSLINMKDCEIVALCIDRKLGIP